MYVESVKRYNQGFVLREQDLRRFVDLMNEQFKKISTEVVEYSYTIKYKNGAIAITPDLEIVLKQENEGSASIEHLEITGTQTNSGKESSIKLDFRNPEGIEKEIIGAIKYSIRGQSRDWVFITTSLIEERIDKIKRRQINLSPVTFRGRLTKELIKLLFSIALMISLLISLIDGAKEITSVRGKVIGEIEAKWKSHSITDPIDIIIQIEKSKHSLESDLNVTTLLFITLTSKPFIIAIVSLILLVICYSIYLKNYPEYNFYWGNYMDIFDKKEKTRKVLLGVILTTIILGIIVNLVSNFIWEKI